MLHKLKPPHDNLSKIPKRQSSLNSRAYALKVSKNGLAACLVHDYHGVNRKVTNTKISWKVKHVTLPFKPTK